MVEVYLCPPLKYDGIMARAFGVGESTHSLRTFVLESSEQLVELLYAQRLQEPLATICSMLDKISYLWRKKRNISDELSYT